jgi:cysteine desulfurase/selenocysteine lyase
MAEIENFKRAFFSSSTMTHMNNAGVGPMCQPARDAVRAWTEAFFERGYFAAMDVLPLYQKTRENLGLLLNADPAQIAFFQATSMALSQLAFGLQEELSPGDEILLWDQEYPSNFYPWRDVAARTGARLVIAKSAASGATPVENLLSQITPKTKVISVSWVQYQTGAITDLKALTEYTKARGILVFADIIQGAGFLPFDFKESGVDAACGGSHKWFAAPLSTGYLCLAPGLLDRLQPIMVGAMTYGTPDDPNRLDAKPRADAARLEPGSRSPLNMVGLNASLELILSTGVHRIGQEVEWLSRKLAHGIRERGYLLHSPHGAHHRGSIVNFSPGPDAALQDLASIERALTGAQISFAKRPPGIRLSPHAFNTQTEIEKVLRTLEVRFE